MASRMLIANRPGVLVHTGVHRGIVAQCLELDGISDTHGLLRPEVEQRLAGVAHIVHVGDIGSPNVIAGLQRIVPVIAIRGNVDTGHWAEQYPSNDVVCRRTSDAPTKLNW
jgi:hypothetical protein